VNRDRARKPDLTLLGKEYCNYFAYRGSIFIARIKVNKDTGMKMEYAIRILAGFMVLISISMAHWVNPWWLLLAAFVSLNLIQSAFTRFCPAEIILKKLGVGRNASGEGACCCR
jgi:hypothetical protein